MLTALAAAAILSGFAVLYPLARRRLVTVLPPGGAPPAIPFVLVAAASFLALVFNVERQDGNAVLEQGLTASNVTAIAIVGLTGLYLAGKIALDRRVLLLPFAMPYLPFTLMTAVNLASALWSIVPGYTAYRAVELSILALAAILVFDRPDIDRRIGGILAAFTAVWLLAVSPTILQSLSGGIVFSSAKNNMMPLVCAALVFVAIFEPRTRHRVLYAALGLVGFIVAGSAASTGALAAVLPALMIASRRRGVRIAGVVVALVIVAVFFVLMVGLSLFPALLDFLSVVLQKPAVELANATGRTSIWPSFLEATQHKLLGSGFSAADRFIQLLLPTTALTDEFGRDTVFITSAHNMYLSAWAGTGLVGILFAACCLVAPLRWAARATLPARRVVGSTILMLVCNGMTTPGIFQDWNLNVLAYIAVLAYARCSARPRAAPAAATTPAWRGTALPSLRPLASAP